jgi:phosphatidate cytidylyltransferase
MNAMSVLNPAALAYNQQTLILFAAVVGTLVFASIVGFVLKRRVAHGQPHTVIDNLNARVYAWWVMVALVTLALWFGKGGAIWLFAFTSFFALREFITITYTRRSDHLPLALTFFFFLPVQYYLVWIDWHGLYTILIPVYAFLFLPIVAALSQDSTRFLERTGSVQWGLMICVYCISHVPALLNLQIPGYEGREVLLIAFLVLVVQGSDVLQYVFGKLFGKHKVAPLLSPSKTIEGLFGGIASATVLGAMFYWLTPFSPLAAAAMAFGICVMGFLGGLVMSAIKRDRNVKDWGHMIEGHGGMLDRMDSVCFAAPVFFHVTRYFWTV